MKGVSWPHRIRPAQIVYSGRSQTRHTRKIMIDIQAHGNTRRMPARSDDSAEASLLGLLGIDVHVLWVETLSELDNFGLCHDRAAKLKNSARLVVLEITILTSHCELRKGHAP